MTSQNLVKILHKIAKKLCIMFTKQEKSGIIVMLSKKTKERNYEYKEKINHSLSNYAITNNDIM